MSHMLNIFNCKILIALSGNFKMLHFDANPIRMEYLVTELWEMYELSKQY